MSFGHFECKYQPCSQPDCPLKRAPMGASQKAMDLIKKHQCKLVKKLFDDKKEALNDSNSASIEDNTSFDSQVSLECELSKNGSLNVMPNIPHDSNTPGESNAEAFSVEKEGNGNVIDGAEMPQKCELSKNGSLNVMLNIPHDSNAPEAEAFSVEKEGNGNVTDRPTNVMLNIPHDLPDLSSYLPKTGEYTVMISGKPMKSMVVDNNMPKGKQKILASDTDSEKEKEVISAEGKDVVSKSECEDLDGQIDTDCSTLAKAKLIELAKLSSASTISMSDTSAYSQPNESDNVIPYEQFLGELKQKEDQENTADD